MASTVVEQNDVLLERCGEREIVARWSSLARGWRWTKYVAGHIEAQGKSISDTPDGAFERYRRWVLGVEPIEMAWRPPRERGPLVTLANGVLHRRRRQLHLTQHQLADLLGTTRQHISHLERGHHGDRTWPVRCTLVTAEHIADVLGIPLDDLVDRSGDCGEGDE